MLRTTSIFRRVLARTSEDLRKVYMISEEPMILRIAVPRVKYLMSSLSKSGKRVGEEEEEEEGVEV